MEKQQIFRIVVYFTSDEKSCLIDNKLPIRYADLSVKENTRRRKYRMKMIRKLLSVVLALAMLLSIAGMALAQTADGTYEGVAQGMGGDVKVSVTVSGSVITDVTVLSQNETVGISDPALKSIPAAIVEANSTEVDAAAGATVTSEAIKTAVQNALDGVQEEDAAEVVVPFDHIDVIVVGGGLGGLAATVRASELGANVLLIEADIQIGRKRSACRRLSGGCQYAASKRKTASRIPWS